VAQTFPNSGDDEIALRKFVRTLQSALQQVDPHTYSPSPLSAETIFESVRSDRMRKHLDDVHEARRVIGLLGLSGDPPGSTIVRGLIGGLEEFLQTAAQALSTVKAERRNKTKDEISKTPSPRSRQRLRDFDDLIYGGAAIYCELVGRRPTFSENPQRGKRARALHSPFGAMMLRLIEQIPRDFREGWYGVDKGCQPLARPTMDSIRGAWERADKRRRVQQPG
jgi:hypothetical protein